MTDECVSKELRKPLGPEYVATKTGFPYLQGHQAITLANRIFGYNGWSMDVLDSEVEEYEESNNRYSYLINSKVRVTLKDGAFHEDFGFGKSLNLPSQLQAFEKASKEAVTDALKRALHYFGESLGSCLSNKAFTDVLQKTKPERTPFDLGDLRRQSDIICSAIGTSANFWDVKTGAATKEPEASRSVLPSHSTPACTTIPVGVSAVSLKRPLVVEDDEEDEVPDFPSDALFEDDDELPPDFPSDVVYEGDNNIATLSDDLPPSFPSDIEFESDTGEAITGRANAADLQNIRSNNPRSSIAHTPQETNSRATQAPAKACHTAGNLAKPQKSVANSLENTIDTHSKSDSSNVSSDKGSNLNAGFTSAGDYENCGSADASDSMFISGADYDNSVVAEKPFKAEPFNVNKSMIPSARLSQNVSTKVFR